MKLLLGMLIFSLLTNGVLFFWLLAVTKDLDFFRRDSAKWYGVACKLQNDEKLTQRPLTTVPAEIMQKIDDLERENAQLRTDVETGCKLIDEQRGRLSAISAETRRLLAAFKGRK